MTVSTTRPYLKTQYRSRVATTEARDNIYRRLSIGPELLHDPILCADLLSCHPPSRRLGRLNNELRMEESAEDLKGLATKIMNGYQGMYGHPLVIWQPNVGRPGWNKLSREDQRVFLIRALDKG